MTMPFSTLMVSVMNLATEASSKKAPTITIANWSFILTRKLEWNVLFLSTFLNYSLISELSPDGTARIFS